METDAQGHQRKMNYLYGGNGLFAIYVENNGADTMYYIQKNYLGSYYCVTNTSGNIVTMDGQQQVYSFDPWGRRRNATTWTYSNVPNTFLFDRCFTGQEHLDVFGLINMNGRSYDFRLGRFLSPDPQIQDMSNTQSYNSYTYANNNPLKYVDPSGYNAAVAVITMPNDNPFSDETVSSSGGGGGSSYGDYTYDWSTGVYLDRYGNLVSWNEVNNNYVLPNASKTYNFSSISAGPLASVNFSFSALLSGQIGYAYFEPGSSYTSSNGQHVGFGVIDASSVLNGKSESNGGISNTTSTAVGFASIIAGSRKITQYDVMTGDAVLFRASARYFFFLGEGLSFMQFIEARKQGDVYAEQRAALDMFMGAISITGIGFGISAVYFTAESLGAFDPQLGIPENIAPVQMFPADKTNFYIAPPISLQPYFQSSPAITPSIIGGVCYP